ncbi:MAG TPA: ornithine carbamoyltransferase [candidate division Zixibacteria bacterium]|nr:ornithine carbamoyltransferase [candidate division Zixibacteria bacterium]
MKRDFLSINELTPKEVKDILAGAKVLKHMTSWGDSPKPLNGKAVALIFRKPSLRTRVSFDVGVYQFGGHPMVITDAEIGMGKRESVHDIAKVLSRYVSLIVIRTFEQSEVEELAKYADVPVINALTNLLHPCQIMGDALTIMEHQGSIDGMKIAYVGDGNNIVNSWLNFSKKIKIDLRIGTSKDTQPDATILAEAQAEGMSQIMLTDDPIEAVNGADVIYTDVWASMGEKEKATEKATFLGNFQINAELLKHASPNAIVLHCLPAERGREITDEVIDGPQSVVFDEAENRLHIQKSIMQFLTTGLV